MARIELLKELLEDLEECHKEDDGRALVEKVRRLCSKARLAVEGHPNADATLQAFKNGVYGTALSYIQAMLGNPEKGPPGI